LIGFAVASHSFAAGDVIRAANTANYDNVDLTVNAATTTTKVVVSGATFVAEKMSGQFLLYKQSITTAEIQAAFDALCYMPGKWNQTAQFADGWYPLSTNLYFTGIRGDVQIRGNALDVTASLNKRVVLAGAGNADLRFSRCSGWSIKSVGFYRTGYSSGSGSVALSFSESCQSAHGSFVTAASGVAINSVMSSFLSQNVIFRGGNTAIKATTGGTVRVYANSSVATFPSYGVYSDGALVTRDASQIDGITQDDVGVNGGRVFTPTATIPTL